MVAPACIAAAWSWANCSVPFFTSPENLAAALTSVCSKSMPAVVALTMPDVSAASDSTDATPMARVNDPTAFVTPRKPTWADRVNVPSFDCMRVMGAVILSTALKIVAISNLLATTTPFLLL
ncbi:hypothetical protein D3C73_817140 [compost metagenome]